LRLLILILTFFVSTVVLFTTETTYASYSISVINDSISGKKSNLTPPIIKKDSTTLDTTKHTTSIDSVQQNNPSEIKYAKNSVDTLITYQAEDSIVFDAVSNKVFLFKNAKVHYKELELESYHIDVNWKLHEVTATGNTDSINPKKGNPLFKDGEKSFQSKKMVYNIDNRKGKIYDLVTKEEEGYIHSEQVKRLGEEEYYSYHATYTTCDAEEPHFGFKAKKMMVIPDKLIVTGPANLVIENIPTPIVLPFGIFPIKKGQTSGLLMPAPGQDINRGFFLRNGGYYFVLGHHHDLAITGDIYSFGSYGVHINSAYNYLYKANGNFSLQYGSTRIGDPQEPRFNVRKDFKINWRHVQDPRANPNNQFSSSVEMGSSRYDRNNSQDATEFLTNTYQSSISYQHIFPGKPINFSLTAGHNQNNRTREMNFDLPSINFSVNRLYPFAKKSGVGKKRWYDLIGISYSARAINHLQTYDSLLFTTTKWDDFNKGITHYIPVSASFNILKYINITPTISYNERWYFNTSIQSRDSLDRIVRTKQNEFKTERDWSATLSFSTRLYGIKQFKHGKIKAIRHVVVPTVALNYHPNYGESKYGYYVYNPADTNGKSTMYSIFEGNLIGGPPSPGKYGAVVFGVNNDLEMKVYSKKDSINHSKRITLLRSFGINTSYNMAADSFHWSVISVIASTVILQKINVNFNMGIDPYSYVSPTRRIDKLAINESGKIGKINNANVSIGSAFSTKNAPSDKSNAASIRRGNTEINTNTIPFSINANYTLFISPRVINFRDTIIYNQSLSCNSDIGLTPFWKVGFNAGYDIKAKRLDVTSLNLTRDLHCWVLRVNIAPGRFYSIDLNVKAQVLNDLKLSRRRQINSYIF